MTFDEWLEEMEVYSTREERLWSEFDGAYFAESIKRKRMMDWLRAAYEIGRQDGVENAVPEVEMDGFMNELGWEMHDWLSSNDGRVNNHIKPFLKSMIEKWIEEKVDKPNQS